MKYFKYLIIAFIFLLFVVPVTAITYDWLYNPYTSRKDRSLSNNQTGDNFTADNFFGIGMNLDGNLIVNGTVDILNHYNSTQIEEMNTTLNNKIETYNNSISGKFSNDTYVLEVNATTVGKFSNDTYVLEVNATTVGKFIDTNETDRVNELEDANVSTNIRVDDLNLTKLDIADFNNLEENFTSQNTTNYIEFLLANGSNPLTANWFAGAFLIDVQNMSTTMSWWNLTDYPAACPANSYVTQIEDSITCTELIDTNETDRVDELEIANVSTNLRVDDLNVTKLENNTRVNFSELYVAGNTYFSDNVFLSSSSLAVYYDVTSPDDSASCYYMYGGDGKICRDDEFDYVDIISGTVGLIRIHEEGNVAINDSADEPTFPDAALYVEGEIRADRIEVSDLGGNISDLKTIINNNSQTICGENTALLGNDIETCYPLDLGSSCASGSFCTGANTYSFSKMTTGTTTGSLTTSGFVRAENGVLGLYAYGELDDSGTSSADDIAFGEGSTVLDRTTFDNLIWNSVDNTWKCKSAMEVEVFLSAAVLTGTTTLVDFQVNVNDVLQGRPKRLTIHASTDPNDVTLLRFVTCPKNAFINVTMDSASANAVTFQAGSSMSVERKG